MGASGSSSIAWGAVAIVGVQGCWTESECKVSVKTGQDLKGSGQGCKRLCQVIQA